MPESEVVGILSQASPSFMTRNPGLFAEQAQTAEKVEAPRKPERTGTMLPQRSSATQPWRTMAIALLISNLFWAGMALALFGPVGLLLAIAFATVGAIVCRATK